MNAAKIKTFMNLAGQEIAEKIDFSSSAQRELGAALLLSEVLEYVVHGLGVTPVFEGKAITEPNDLQYKSERTPDGLEMVDGLADVAYTMYWNACAFGLPLEEAFELVCDNNLDKFVRLTSWKQGTGELDKNDWHCHADVSWPNEVVKVEVIQIGMEFYAVGKDENGKVRKPSHYKPVDLEPLLQRRAA